MAARKSFDILRDKSLYKSIAFTRKERLRLGLEGLLPHVVAISQMVQVLLRLHGEMGIERLNLGHCGFE